MKSWKKKCNQFNQVNLNKSRNQLHIHKYYITTAIMLSQFLKSFFTVLNVIAENLVSKILNQRSEATGIHLFSLCIMLPKFHTDIDVIESYVRNLNFIWRYMKLAVKLNDLKAQIHIHASFSHNAKCKCKKSSLEKASLSYFYDIFRIK